MIRKRVALPITALLLLLVTFQGLLTPASPVAANSLGQVFAGYCLSSYGYSGADAFMTHPQTNLAANWTVVLTSTTNLFTTGFIEAGAMQDCAFDCNRLFPYAAWTDINGSYDTKKYTGTNLAFDGWYEYKTTFVGNNVWQAIWCNGNGCYQLWAPNLGTSTAFTYAGGGIETYDVTLPMGGTAHTAGNGYYTNGPWVITCYEGTYINVGGNVGACFSGSWWDDTWQ